MISSLSSLYILLWLLVFDWTVCGHRTFCNSFFYSAHATEHGRLTLARVALLILISGWFWCRYTHHCPTNVVNLLCKPFWLHIAESHNNNPIMLNGFYKWTEIAFNVVWFFSVTGLMKMSFCQIVFANFWHLQIVSCLPKPH